MATLKRTFTNRGKHEITAASVKPNGVYYCEATITAEQAAMRGINQAVAGLVMLDSVCNIRRTYNIDINDMWQNVHYSIDSVMSIHLWRASIEERHFAHAAEDAEVLGIKCKSLSRMLRDRDLHISYYETNLFHRIAERLTRFFS